MIYQHRNWAVVVQNPNGPELLYDLEKGIAPRIFIETPPGERRVNREPRGLTSVSDTLFVRLNRSGVATTGLAPSDFSHGVPWSIFPDPSFRAPEPTDVFHAYEDATGQDVIAATGMGNTNLAPNLAAHVDQRRPMCFVHPLNQPFYGTYSDIARIPWEPAGWSVIYRHHAQAAAKPQDIVAEQCNAAGFTKHAVIGGDWNTAAHAAKKAKSLRLTAPHHIAGVGTFQQREEALDFFTEDYECAVACEAALRSVLSTTANPMDPEFLDQIEKKLFMALLRGTEKDRP